MKPSPLATTVEQALELGRTFAPAAQRALKDPDVRRALTATAIQARELYDEVRRDSAHKLGSRLARDRRFQEDLGELVRNAAETVDQARAPKKRRLRRVILWVGVIGGTAFVAFKFLKRGADDDAPASSDPAGISPNGVAQSSSEPGSQYASRP